MTRTVTHRRVLALALLAASSSGLAAGDAELGRQRAEELGCQACHGPDGNGVTPRVAQAPRLAGQYADYLVRALLDYRIGNRTNPIMSGLAANLSDADRANLAAFYASQQGLLVLHR